VGVLPEICGPLRNLYFMSSNERPYTIIPASVYCLTQTFSVFHSVWEHHLCFKIISYFKIIDFNEKIIITVIAGDIVINSQKRHLRCLYLIGRFFGFAYYLYTSKIVNTTIYMYWFGKSVHQSRSAYYCAIYPNNKIFRHDFYFFVSLGAAIRGRCGMRVDAPYERSWTWRFLWIRQTAMMDIHCPSSNSRWFFFSLLYMFFVFLIT